MKQGKRVQKGEVLAVLEQGQYAAQVKAAAAGVARAEARLRDLEAGARPEEIAEAAAVCDQARAAHERALKEWERAKLLFEQGAAPAQELDRAEAALAAATAQLEAAKQRLALLKAGPRPEVVAQARQEVLQARAALEQAQLNLERTVVRAPLAGTVLLTNFEEGEFVSPGVPIVTLADLDKLWLVLYLPETDLGRVKIGQKVVVTVDSFPGRVFWGKVADIAREAEFTPKFIQTRKERVNLVFRVKVALPNPEGLLKPGMPADARILTGGGSGA